MWMHFAIFCSMELENANSHRHAEAGIAAFAHPGYKYPLESDDSMILPPSSPKGYQSKNLHTGHQQCFFLEGTLAVNPFTNVNLLDVFRNLSCGGEGSELLFSTRESTSCSPSVSSKCASTQKSSPAQVILDTLPRTEHAYAFPRNHLQSQLRSNMDFPILNPHSGICQPLHFDDSLTPCKVKNLLHHKGKDIDDHNITVQHSKILPAASHPYFNEKASTVSAIGLGCKATHLNHVVFSGVDHVTSFTVAGAVPNPTFLSHSEQSRTSVCEMGKITSVDAGNRAFDLEKKGPFDMDEEQKRSLYDLINVDESSPSFNDCRFTPSADHTELSYCDLDDNYLSFSPVASRTPEIKSPLNFDVARPTNISNMSCYNPSSVCSILRGSSKNIQSLDLKSCHRQLYVKEEQSQTKSRQYYMQCERILDQSTCRSQMWQFNKKSEDLGSK